MNSTNLSQNDAYKTLINFCVDIPIAFAIWENQSDVILLSSKMQSLIRADSLIINSLNFVKSIKPIFGNFLYDAVSKISTTQFSNGKYSTIFKTPYNKVYSLILNYNMRSQIYIFTALDITNNTNLIDNNNNAQTNELKVLNEILDKIPLYIWRKNKDSKIIYNNKYCTSNLGNKINDLNILRNNNISNDINTPVKIKGEDRILNINEYLSAYNKNQIIGIATDVTELNNIKKELLQYKTSNDNIDTVINNINCGVALFNSSMKLILINDYTKELFKLSNTDVYSKSYSEIIDYILSSELIVSNVSNTILRNKLLEIFSIVKDKPLEKHISIDNKENIKVSIIPDIKGNILFMFSDNSDSIDMARNINSVKQIYSKVMSNISEGIIIFGSDNKIKVYNDIAKNIFSIEKEDVNNLNIKDFFELAKDLFNNNLEQFTNKLINNATQRTNYSEIINLTNNKIIDYTYTPIHDGLSLILLKDISNYKTMEVSLKTASDKVNQVIDLKNKLMNTIADEYCAPLNTISSFAEILNNKYFGELNEKQQEYCSSIIKTTNHLKDIAEMIRYIAMIQTDQLKLNLTEVNISSFIKTTIEQFRDLEKDVKITVTCNNNSLKAYIDKTIVNRILYYAILQSICMLDDNGIIQIESSISEEDPKYFVINISDNGYGLSQDDVIIYNRYLSNNINIGEIKTMDLKYALLHHMVHFHNGNVSLESKENEGSKIKILLQINQFNH